MCIPKWLYANRTPSFLIFDSTWSLFLFVQCFLFKNYSSGFKPCTQWSISLGRIALIEPISTKLEPTNLIRNWIELKPAKNIIFVNERRNFFTMKIFQKQVLVWTWLLNDFFIPLDLFVLHLSYLKLFKFPGMYNLKKYTFFSKILFTHCAKIKTFLDWCC